MRLENDGVIMLVLNRRFIGGLLKKYIDECPGMSAFTEYDYNNAIFNAAKNKPNISLVEIPERHGTPAADTLRLCREIKEASHMCKIILLCPEIDEISVRECVRAKQQGDIEDFLFYDSTTQYLISKLEAMQSAERKN